MSKKYDDCHYVKNVLNLGLALGISAFYPTQANAVNVSTWSELNTTENISVTADIQAEGSPQIINISSGNPQTIDGGHHSLTGASSYQFRILNTNADSGITIKNFGTVVDGTAGEHTFSYTDANGDIIYKTITKSISGFTNGAFSLLAHPRKVTIDNVVYRDNINETLNITLQDVTNTSSITNTIFYGNTDATDHKAILTLGKGTFEIDNLIFDSNEAEQGIEFFSGTTTNINNSIFQNNTQDGYNHSYYDYGTLQIGSGVVNINNSQFINNHTIINDGGAISVTNGLQSVINSVFKDNSAGNTGGAIWDMGHMTIHYYDNVTFEHNQSPYGGAIYTAIASDITFVDTNFTNNIANEGAAIYSERTNLNIFANTKDVTFSGNTANNTTDTYNGGAAVYYDVRNQTGFAFNINAASGKKVIFDNTIAAYGSVDVIMNINKSGLSYNDINGNPVTITNVGEIQFNDKVGDESGNIFNINLYGGTLSIGQNATLNAGFANPDGLINNNKFYVKGNAVLNTANAVIGSFAPAVFNIESGNTLEYKMDVDLSGSGSSDTLTITSNEGTLKLSSFNVIADADVTDLAIKYSASNVSGAVKDGYTITTSTANYDVTAQNDASGSYVVFTKTGSGGGLPNAIQNASNAYSITSDADEVISAWSGTNSLLADLEINGNNHGFTTSNGLDGINVGNTLALTMNNVSDMTGFNYAFANEGTVNLTNTTISDDIVNNGTLEINNNVTLGALSGTGTANINADHEVSGAWSGNTVNVKNATLSGVNNLGADVSLNVIGGTIALNNQKATVKSADFDASSTLALTINSSSDYGNLTADTITVANGATLKATLAQGIVKDGQSVTLQLLKADNTDFNNFTDSFDNNMYHFEKADKNGNYTITQTNSGGDVVIEDGGQQWVADAASAYIDGNSFEPGTVAAEIADKLASLAQNDVDALITEIKALAPTETATVQGQSVEEASRLFKTVDSYLRGERDPLGISSGDILTDVDIWAKPYFGQSRISKSHNIASQKTLSRGIITGVEKKLDKTLKVGVGLQYDSTDIDAKRRNTDISTVVGFVYGEYKPSQWFINGTLSYGQSGYDEYKYALGSKYKADYDVRMTSVAAVSGYQFKYFTPEAGLRYYHITREAYRDTASQYVHASTSDYLRATAGIRLAKDYGIYRPDVYFGLAYDVTTPKNNTLVNLTNGTNYVVKGKRLSRMEYELNLGLNAHLTDKTTIGASYMGAYRNGYQEHTLIFRFKYDF